MKENFLNYVPLKVYRYLRWRKPRMEQYRLNCSRFSKAYADICLDAERARYFNRPNAQQLYSRKDEYILNYLENLCGDVIATYKTRTAAPSQTEEKKRIWVMWWTGEESAPPIVKACVKSIRANAAGHEVVFLDASNYTEYVQLPEFLIEKHEKGLIGHAHFSDVVRLSLLAQYGGVWIDATVFISRELPENLFSDPFYTLKTVNENAPYYSKSRWCGYFLAGNSGFPLFSFVRDMLLAYWERSQYVIDYLLMDYLFGIACRQFEEVSRAMEQLPDNNPRRGMLMDAINEPYDAALFASLEQGDTFASKLSWRYGNPREWTSDGQLTNYGHLLRK